MCNLSIKLYRIYALYTNAHHGLLENHATQATQGLFFAVLRYMTLHIALGIISGFA